MQKSVFLPNNGFKYGGRMTKPTPRTKITERQSVPATIVGKENEPKFGIGEPVFPAPEQHESAQHRHVVSGSHSGPNPPSDPVPVHQSPKFSTTQVRKPVVNVFEPSPQSETIQVKQMEQRR